MIDTYYRNFFEQLPTENPQYRLTIITPPAEEPIDYTELSAFLRLDQSYDQSLVEALGVAARLFFETYTKLTVIETVFEVSFDNFNDLGMRLPRRPCSEVNEVRYIDTLGDEQTLDPSLYTFDQKDIYSRIRPVRGTTFPATNHQPNSVTIQFTAGAEDAASVDDLSKTAIKMLADHFYNNRSPVVSVATGSSAKLPFGLDAMLSALNAPEII